MSKLVHKYGDAEIGDIVTLKSGGPPMTLVKFVPADSPPIPDGIQNSQWSDSTTTLSAQVMWVAENGTLGQATILVAALDFKDDGPDDKVDPAARVHADADAKRRAAEAANRRLGGQGGQSGSDFSA